MLGSANLMAQFALPDAVTRTVVGDEITFTKAAWLAIFHVLLLIAFIVVLTWVLRATWKSIRLPWVARGAALSIVGLIWVCFLYALLASVIWRNDHVVVTPDHIEFVKRGQSRVIRYQDIRSMEWYTTRSMGRNPKIHRHTRFYLRNGEQVVYSGDHVEAATRLASDIMIEQGLMDPGNPRGDP